VNGERVEVARALARGDVIRFGVEEFRFHADAVPVAPIGVGPGQAGAAASGNGLLPALATLEIVNEGVFKGRSFDLGRPLTHLGRGAHNDIVIADETVSDSHAKIQRRETGWYLVDVGSTNGTYVAGQRIVNEYPISGPTDVRFGGIKMMFRPAVETAGPGPGTRVVAAVQPTGLRRPEASFREPPVAGAPSRNDATAPMPAAIPPDPTSQPARAMWTLWVAAAAIVVVTLYLVLQGR
jgi:pSer/pThr/pTyr-binding forkhead associated (FHA) protein